jgi:hypothetical protein
MHPLFNLRCGTCGPFFELTAIDSLAARASLVILLVSEFQQFIVELRTQRRLANLSREHPHHSLQP